MESAGIGPLLRDMSDPVEETARPPLVVVMLGLAGSGKSTVARALEHELGLRRVSRDTIRDAMFPRFSYSFVEKRAAFRTVLLAIEINCLIGDSMVVDGMTFSRREHFEQIVTLAAAHGFGVLPLMIDCPMALARARIATLPGSRLSVGAGNVGFSSQSVPQFEPTPPTAIHIDGSRPTGDVCSLAKTEVGARLPRPLLKA